MFVDRCLRLMLLGALLLRAVSAAAAPNLTFSVDPASPSINGNLTPDDVLAPGPVVAIQGSSLGLADNFFAGNYDNLADFSYGRDPLTGPLYFSVDRVAVGLPGSAVFSAAAPGVESAAADVFVSQPPTGSNALAFSQVALGLAPGFFGDDVDGLSLLATQSPNVYFAVDRFSAANDFGSGVLASNLLVSAGDGHFSVYATNSMMGLAAGDAIDGLVLWSPATDLKGQAGVDKALFSVDPFSPDAFTSTGLNYIACVPGHMSPADVCYTDFSGTFSLWIPAAGLGLRNDDNLDAIATIPEPSASAVIAIGLLLVWTVRSKLRSTGG